MSTEDLPSDSEESSSSEDSQTPQLLNVSTAADENSVEGPLCMSKLPGHQRDDALDELQEKNSTKKRRLFAKKLVPQPSAQRDSRINQIMQTMEEGLKEIDVHESLEIPPGPKEQRINQILSIMEKGLEEIDVRQTLEDDPI